MAKDFKTQANKSVLRDLMSGAVEPDAAKENTKAAPDREQTTDSRFEQPQKAVYYRFNLKMPLEYEEYLKNAAIKASVSAGRQITVTEYINMLIREDMKANG